MDEQMVREHIAEIRGRLKTIETEREVLLTLLRGYEGWLRLYSNGAAGAQLPLLAATVTQSAPKRVSFRGAIRQVLEAARGEPLHVKEILLRVQELGAQTQAKEPTAAVDFTCYSFKGAAQRVAPRTWRWVGDDS